WSRSRTQPRPRRPPPLSHSAESTPRGRQRVTTWSAFGELLGSGSDLAGLGLADEFEGAGAFDDPLAFVLGQTTPDAVRRSDGQSVSSALFAHRAGAADCLGAVITPIP